MLIFDSRAHMTAVSETCGDCRECWSAELRCVTASRLSLPTDFLPESLSSWDGIEIFRFSTIIEISSLISFPHPSPGLLVMALHYHLI